MLMLQLTAVALAVAAFSFLIFWFTQPKNKVASSDYPQFLWHRAIGFIAFLTFDLIIFGSFTRLTDSGLGCPDWPGCYQKMSAWHAFDAIFAAQQILPDGPVTIKKAWIEMLHRYFAMGLGVLVIALTVYTWLKSCLKPFRYWTLAILLLICVQGAFGAWTVTLKLQPLVVTIHLLLGISLLSLLLYCAERFDPLLAQKRWHLPKFFKYLFLIALFLVFVQIALGAWVSANYAVLACTDIPQCQGQWWPPMNFAEGFSLWRPLGYQSDGQLLSLSALVAIHWTHRTFALLVFLYCFILIFLLRRYSICHRTMCSLFLLILLQSASGVSNILFSWPLFSALIHSAGAALWVGFLIRTYIRCD